MASLAEEKDFDVVAQGDGSGDIDKRVRYGISEDRLLHFMALHRGPQLFSRLNDQYRDSDFSFLTRVCVASIMSNAMAFCEFLEKLKRGTDLTLSDLSSIREQLGAVKGTQDTALHLAATYSTKEEFESIMNTLTRPTWDRDPWCIESRDVYDIKDKWNYLFRLKNGNGETVLHRAAAMSNFGVVSYICEKAPDAACQLDSMSRSTLWHAACGGDERIISVIEMALESSSWAPTVDYPDENGLTPLHAACREGFPNCVKALLNLGASPLCAAHSSGLTPIHYASLFGHYDCLVAMAQHPDARSGFFQVVGMVDDVELIRPIHLAAANGWNQCVRLLIGYGSPLSPLASVICIVRDSPSNPAPIPIGPFSPHPPTETEVQLQRVQLSTPKEVAAKRGWDVVVTILEVEEALQEHRDLAGRVMPVIAPTLTNTGLTRTRRTTDLLELLHNSFRKNQLR